MTLLCIFYTRTFFYDNEEECDEPYDENPETTGGCHKVLFIDNYQYKDGEVNEVGNKKLSEQKSSDYEKISKLLCLFRASINSSNGSAVMVGMYGSEPESPEEVESIVDLFCRHRSDKLAVQALFAMAETHAVQWSHATANYAFAAVSKTFKDYPRLVSRYRILLELFPSL